MKPASCYLVGREYQKRRNMRYQCLACEYIYDPAEGDPTSGIEPETSFDNLPSDWVCPECGVEKDQFEEIVE